MTKYAPTKLIFCISTKNLKLGLKFAINIRTGERFDFVTEGELLTLLVDKEVAKNKNINFIHYNIVLHSKQIAHVAKII